MFPNIARRAYFFCGSLTLFAVFAGRFGDHANHFGGCGGGEVGIEFFLGADAAQFARS
jgi:hypothetical protein